ncbi:MAG: hypothetical protein U0514_03500 [Candidatus Andersenbacteria bacterium]
MRRRIHTQASVVLLLCLLGAAAGGLPIPAQAGTLVCTVRTSCNAGEVDVLGLSSTAGGHAEVSGQTNYTNRVCCGGITGIGASCSGTFITPLKLSGTTNAHVERNTSLNYGSNACIQVPAGGSISMGYQTTNCSGFDTTVASVDGTVTNMHAGDANAYTNKVCATGIGPPTITFSISDNFIGFGSLSATAARYATGDTLGSASEVEAHQLAVSTNAPSGYVLTLTGNTLTSGANTITDMGCSNTASSPGTSQFGVRMTASGGTGVVSAPYDGSGFAFCTTNFPDDVASATFGDNNTTTYSVRYLANITSTTPPGSYSSILTYVATATF